MFFSHEILANTQYGVATIWMIATTGTGKGSQRKITKKAINEVNVPKACKTFTNPEAPLALRLQGNLLYGVSRVFEQQTGYVLSEAERIQSDMMSYFRALKQDNIDPQGGKAKRQNINLPDDPNFDPFAALPGLDLLNALQWNSDVDQLFPTQKTDSQKYSQFTPPATQNSSSGRGNISINLPDEFSYGSYRLPSDLGRNSPAGWKPNYPSDSGGFRLEGDQDAPIDLGFDFDADGNMIDYMNPDVPAFPGTDSENPNKLTEQHDEAPVRILGSDEEQGVRIIAEEPLPDAEAFPSRKAAPQHHSSTTHGSESTEVTRAAAAKLKRKARMKKMKALMDTNPEITRQEMKEWQNNYLDRMEDARDQPRPITSLAQARKNALDFLYVGGIAGVGFPFASDAPSFVHPLAEDFSGKLFKARILDREVEDDEFITPKNRRLRRDHSEAFADD